MSGRPMYAVAAVVTTVADGWSSSRQVPIFYLDPVVQGIVSEAHACEVAREVIDPLGGAEVHVTAVLV